MVDVSFAPILGWTTLAAPLASSLLILLLGLHRRRLAAALAIAGLLGAFGCTLQLFLLAVNGLLALPFESSILWISLPGFTVEGGILLDELSLLMALVVTGVGSAIFIYSTAYMADDAAYSRYFGMLCLFVCSMLIIVLANNWVQLFIGWELVGFSSYMLIGHWYAKPAAADAGKKAFMVNRVADFGFLLGILALWAVSSPIAAQRTFHFQTLQERIPSFASAGLIPTGLLLLIGLLIFCGPIGKSAQFPLHVWLPDAMEGPTPVSALIHAATMVAAGVFLLCRSFWLFEGLPPVMTAIAWVGGLTAFLAACLASVEGDLKRILAYSTLSQLGYMVMALGLGGRVAGMYHLTTHAFFKALLFLAAGSVIHMTHQQDIWKLGGLWRSMRWTSLAFLIGALALCGFPGLSGFFSKDEILVLAHEHSLPLYLIGTVTAGLTAFYITRAWVVAFLGGDQERRAGESPPAMLIPLGLLALLSIAGGYLGIPYFLGQHEGEFHWGVAAVSLAVVAAGIGLGWAVYRLRVVSAKQLVQALALPYSFLRQRYYVDAFYDWYVAAVQQKLFAGFCAWVERRLIIGLGVNGVAALTRGAGELLRRCQTGKVQAYVLVFLVGVLCIVARTVLH